jgi:M6 family metalloprotease-like protein
MQPLLMPMIVLLAMALATGPATADVAEPVSAIGAQRLLVVAVRFPGSEPTLSLAQIKDKISRVDRYLRTVSYGKAWLEPKLGGWYDMPAPVGEYQVSPHNFKVDRSRVRRLVSESLTAARRDVDLSIYPLVWIVVGVFTGPGKGYGMIGYAANPGMLSSVRGDKAKLETVNLPGGGSFSGAVTVSAENAHVGHVVHDLLHALGGASGGKRAVPDLYDYELQSNPGSSPMLPETFAIHAGPWDIMSQHWIERNLPPPAPSSFTRLQLGWIAPDQVIAMKAGETREVALKPLASGAGPLVVRIPLDAGRYLLIENRQKTGADAVLPAAGLLVLEVDTSQPEGTGIVRVANANPSIGKLSGAPFVPGAGEHRVYQNAQAGVAVAPLSLEADGALRVIVTTPGRIKDFVREAGN